MVTGMGGNHEKNRSAMDNEGFYTMKGYERANVDELTSSMEDYLEMVCRMEAEGYPVRVSLLAANLHVRPSSASKMLDNLKILGNTAPSWLRTRGMRRDGICCTGTGCCRNSSAP